MANNPNRPDNHDNLDRSILMPLRWVSMTLLLVITLRTVLVHSIFTHIINVVDAMCWVSGVKPWNSLHIYLHMYIYDPNMIISNINIYTCLIYYSNILLLSLSLSLSLYSIHNSTCIYSRAVAIYLYTYTYTYIYWLYLDDFKVWKPIKRHMPHSLALEDSGIGGKMKLGGRGANSRDRKASVVMSAAELNRVRRAVLAKSTPTQGMYVYIYTN